jgi:AcrR family transcriptional regulator
MCWIRARSEAHKEQRILEIIGATANLYMKMNYEEITFALIAKEAKFARSNLYKYFKNKEEIFLEFIKHDLTRWRTDIGSVCPEKKHTAGDFAARWVDSILEHKRLIELFTILFTSIEKKSSLENLISFKKKVFEETEMIAGFLRNLFPDKTSDTILEFIYAQFALSIGMYPMLNLSENQIAAMKAIGSMTEPDFHKNLFIKAVKALAEKMLY